MCFQKLKTVDDRNLALTFQAATSSISLVSIFVSIILYFFFMRGSQRFMMRLLLFFMYTQFLFSLMNLGDSLIGMLDHGTFGNDSVFICYLSAFIEMYFPQNKFLFISVISHCFINCTLKSRGFLHLKEKRFLSLIYFVPVILAGFPLLLDHLISGGNVCEIYSSPSDIETNLSKILCFFVPLIIYLAYNVYASKKMHTLISRNFSDEPRAQLREKRQFQLYSVLFIFCHCFTVVEFIITMAREKENHNIVITLIHNTVESLNGFLNSVVFVAFNPDISNFLKRKLCCCSCFVWFRVFSSNSRRASVSKNLSKTGYDDILMDSEVV